MPDLISMHKSDKNQLALFETVDHTRPLALARSGDQVSMQDLERYALRVHKKGAFNHPDVHYTLQHGLAVVLAQTFMSSLRDVIRVSR